MLQHRYVNIMLPNNQGLQNGNRALQGKLNDKKKNQSESELDIKVNGTELETIKGFQYQGSIISDRSDYRGAR